MWYIFAESHGKKLKATQLMSVKDLIKLYRAILSSIL